MLQRRFLMGGGGSFPTPPMSVTWAKVYRNSTSTISHNTTTVFTMTTVEYDPAGFWSAGAPTRLTVPSGQNGTYIAVGGTWTNQNPAQDVILFFKVNGAGVRGGYGTYPQTGSNNNPLGYIGPTPLPMELIATDYVEFFGYVDNAAGALTFGHASDISAQTWFALVRVG